MRRVISVLTLLTILFWQVQPVTATLAKKGVERDVTFAMKDTDGDFTDSLTVTASVSKDGGAFAGTDNSVSEISDGLYKITLSATEMTTSVLDLWLSAAGAVDLMVHMELGDYTRADIEAQTDDIGVAGAGLTAVVWNASWDAEVQSEVVDALTAEGYTSTRGAYLDELAAANLPSDVDDILVDTAVIGALGAGLSAIPWNASWDAEVESEVDDSIGGGTGTALTGIPWDSDWDADVQSEVKDALDAYDPPTRDELTTDKESIITEIDANETKIGTYSDTATMSGSLFAGQQAIYDAYGIGSGANTVTLQVSDTSDSTGIASVLVYVMDSANATLLWTVETGASPAGQKLFYADDGTYKLRMYKVGYTADNNPETLTVSGDTTATVYMSENSVGTAVTTSTCRVTINVFEQTGDYYSGQTVSASFVEFSDGTRISSAGAVVCNTSESKETTASGIVYFDLPQESTVRFMFQMPNDRFSVEKTIPAETTKDYDDLVDA